MSKIARCFILDEKVQRIITLLLEGKARDVLIVGGFVRDLLMGNKSKDIDLEVYGLSYREIANILSPEFQVNLVGQSFGVLKVDHDIDVALPRRESKSGIGHKGFEVETNSNLTYEEAFSRRDFTINAIGLRLDGTLVDPFNGQNDIENRLLRAVGPSFADDPLRVLRGMQFASRFGLTMEEATIQMCRSLFSEFPTLSKERLYEEWHKWATKGKYPSKGLSVLLQTGWIQGFPELNNLVDCEQNPAWHPEGDVWTHTNRVCDEMQDFTHFLEEGPEPLTEEEKAILMFAALAHDFGKPSTTTREADGLLHSYNHAMVGGTLARSFLDSMKAPIRIGDWVVPLVLEHMTITSITPEAVTPRAARHLACRLTPANLKFWAYLCYCDACGCNLPGQTCTIQEYENHRQTARTRMDKWLDIGKSVNVINEKPQPLLLGRDLISLGIKPGPEMGQLLDSVYEAQLDGTVTSKEEGIEWLKNIQKQ